VGESKDPHYGSLHSDVIIPMLTAPLPVSAPSNNDWARKMIPPPAAEFPTLFETARPVIAVGGPP